MPRFPSQAAALLLAAFLPLCLAQPASPNPGLRDAALVACPSDPASLYLYGGYNGTAGLAYGNYLWKFNKSAVTWQLLLAYGMSPRVVGTNNPSAVWLPNPPAPPPSTIAEATPFVLGGESIYFARVAAGTRETFVNTTLVFDTNRQIWSVGPPLPIDVNQASAATLNGTAYLGDGYNGVWLQTRFSLVPPLMAWKPLQLATASNPPGKISLFLYSSSTELFAAAPSTGTGTVTGSPAGLGASTLSAVPVGPIAGGVTGVVVILLAVGAYVSWKRRRPTGSDVGGPKETSPVPDNTLADSPSAYDGEIAAPPPRIDLSLRGTPVVYRGLCNFQPRSQDEIGIKLGDENVVRSAFGDGWAQIDNLTMGTSGLAPLSAIGVGRDFHEGP
ncbi:hypothetical protein BDK51DRAFT_26406 [Blyttiomyces helicus]|uniref:SH3 domain-containing protein n=1 Tax=Blyttiomyces helicus TaxID=388810 RepID=A0A4P9W8V2_9FUNG|nr:hypothetical protein BDK51DRAFT_26406 [Blyttiomyces helicus]|eukprot:RKO86606.1 hypothetical protein BDK51DRAFT_26406 [Blyttiomyces helicus]